MTGSPVIVAVQGLLRDVGYADLATPFRVAGVEFSFTAAMRGRDGRSLDLVLLFDTTTGDFGDRDAVQVRQRVEALSRALDVTGSRYVVTAILVGAALAAGVEALAETCRVLLVEGVSLDAEGKPADDDAKNQLEDQVRILLPLTLPPAPPQTEDGSGPAMEQLVRALPPSVGTTMVDVLIAESEKGDEAVTKAVGRAIDAAFQRDAGEEHP